MPRSMVPKPCTLQSFARSGLRSRNLIRIRFFPKKIQIRLKNLLTIYIFFLEKVEGYNEVRILFWYSCIILIKLLVKYFQIIMIGYGQQNRIGRCEFSFFYRITFQLMKNKTDKNSTVLRMAIFFSSNLMKLTKIIPSFCPWAGSGSIQLQRPDPQPCFIFFPGTVRVNVDCEGIL